MMQGNWGGEVQIRESGLKQEELRSLMQYLEVTATNQETMNSEIPLLLSGLLRNTIMITHGLGDWQMTPG